ncbi:cytochrome d ubiquinol oxidase subunit II [Negadavirga shengliensis]|uniref:Cytochrome d ubiquinol oxidase subunit II n=1 Tax=Negadavirga shengliensis TaxID=1389218 RepID=A0ABV9T7E2_9BACT
MTYVVIAFLYVSLLFYILFGGADFGAGIIELFSPKSFKEKSRLLTYRAIGPIWEANHMWLIIAIVILFVGFPEIYSTLSIYLHIPLSLMLLGIIARGTAFIFRHYDPESDNLQRLYNAIYIYSSFLTPLFLGIIAGTVISGNIDPEAEGFLDGYIRPWLSYFPLSVGLFTVGIAGFLACVYLIGEAENELDRKYFRQTAIYFNFSTVLAGALVFVASEWEGMRLLETFLQHPLSILSLVLATISLPVLWFMIRKKHDVFARVVAGFQVTMILFALFYAYFPAFVIMKGQTFSLDAHTAGDSTLTALGIALLAGSILILPALFYLIYSFQKKRFDTASDIVDSVAKDPDLPKDF